MRKFLTSILKKLLNSINEDKSPLSEEKSIKKKLIIKKATPKKQKLLKPSKSKGLSLQELAARDMTEIMEAPFLALSKNRITPIHYESEDGGIKVKVTRHTGHFLASIYDWDIIIFVASKMQEILNTSNDIPPRTMIFPRHEILKSLHKHDGKKEEKDLKASLSRLRLTGIETTIRNEDCKYEAGFGFLDSWGYTQRNDIKEIKITLSQWLYDGICAKGGLLKVDAEYFDITSAIKRFLYRTARKHVGNSHKIWEFSAEKLYEKSASEREYKKFKSDLKITVQANDIPGYRLQWIEKNKKSYVSFKRIKESGLLFEN